MAGFLTNSGLSKLAVATPLTPMTVKYMAFDAGQGTPTPSMSALFNEVYRTEIPNPTKDPDNPKNLTFSGFVPTTVGGWTVYGVGLFDSLNVLVAYLQLAEPVLKSDPSSALKMSWEQDFIITLANAGKTNLIITDSVKFRHDAITHRDLPGSHPISAITDLQPKLDNIQGSLDNNNTSINLDRKYKKITANYTVLSNDGGLIEIDASAGNIVITMAKSTAHIAKEISFVRSDTTSNTVTINPASGDNFRTDGTTYALSVVQPNEVLEAKAGINYWAGIRSSATVLSRSTGNLRIIDNGIDIGQPVLMSDIADMFVGMVAPFAMATTPAGWLPCSGQNVSRIAFNKLFAKIGTIYGIGDGSTTFKLPDLRGEFIRGFDNGRGVDAGRKFGSNQTDELKAHTHTYFKDNVGGSPSAGGSGGGTDTPTGSTGGNETRPRNIALLYCIKY